MAVAVGIQSRGKQVDTERCLATAVTPHHQAAIRLLEENSNARGSGMVGQQRSISLPAGSDRAIFQNVSQASSRRPVAIVVPRDISSAISIRAGGRKHLAPLGNTDRIATDAPPGGALTDRVHAERENVVGAVPAIQPNDDGTARTIRDEMRGRLDGLL